MTLTLDLFTPAGVVLKAAPLRRAAKRLTAHGFDVTIDPAALKKHQRFGGTDDERLAAIHRVAARAPDIALATRGGYGTTRLLDRIDWKLINKSIERGTRWVGHSDLTVFQLALLARGGGAQTWAGPMACDDFGQEVVDDITEACFLEAVHGQLEGIGFRTESGFDGLAIRGKLWGGNLCMVSSMLATPHWPANKITRGGVLFLEDVNEHPYRIERALIQLHQAGVLDAQKAVILGAFSDFRPSPMDRGYGLKTMLSMLRSLTKTPILTGLPFGHVPTKVMLPVGRKVELLVEKRDALMGWQF